ncbi:hypothetical protein NLU13_2078 [Sarocladium strictum]|uniref:Cell wall glycoprotein n=1 Tax=Sarocladium strictum TaxID=5046 RepID=A0AA39LCU2_SARSR|nr:hypothetical protein NLU13_2078 [Sarocladium strictum]
MVARTFALGAAMAAVANAAAMYGNGTVVTTTEVVSTLTTYCPGPTTLTYGDKTYTVTEATTLTITDCPCTLTHPAKPTTTSYPSGDACSTQCAKEYSDCRTAPDANMSFCAANYASCLGYNPFQNGTLVTPTACSAQPTNTVYTTEIVNSYTTYCPEATTLTHGNKTYTVTQPTTLTITDCPCTVTKPIGQPTQQPPAPQPQPSQPAGDECSMKCAQEYSDCRTAPDANMSFCAANYASCLGYNPFENGSLVTPTACSSVVAPPATATGTPTGSGPSQVPTAGAARIVPGALVALGAIALL